MTGRLAALLTFALLLQAQPGLPAQQNQELQDTRHDLALHLLPRQGDRSTDAQCVFCHLPSGDTARVGRWYESEAESLFEYPYDRPAMTTPEGKPDGSTLVCLGCHDGTIALGDTINSAGETGGDNAYSRHGLSDGHPVSLRYDRQLLEANHELVPPTSLPASVRLDDANKIQCTTCHDPHADTYGKFLVMKNGETTLCMACHRKSDWSSSAHATSFATWKLNTSNPWTGTDGSGTVAGHGCANCHRAHGAGDGRYLLNFRQEEQNCLGCHDGNIAATDLKGEFDKLSHHPVGDSTGSHSTRETALLGARDRHVECSDCHNPHALKTEGKNGLSGALNKVRGVDTNGGTIGVITQEFQLCFRCHGDGPGLPPMPVSRVHEQSNTALQFDVGNPSFHPVIGPGNNPNVPSLIAPLMETSTIKCTDCHASDTSSKVGGKGPDGPHGSIYPSLLIRAYLTQDRTPESPTAYALCYRCHDRDSILGDQSFNLHRLHIQSENTPCSVCHDPHGISNTQGNLDNNSHLMNFDTSVVFPTIAGQELFFQDLGNFQGSCSLNCHNSEHIDYSY